MLKRILLIVMPVLGLLGAGQAHAMTSYCAAEMQAAAATDLSPKQRSNLKFYQSFNTQMPGRMEVGLQLVRAHLDHSSGTTWLVSDESPVSACLLKTLADGNRENPMAPYAQEGYALRLLAGTGVPRDREQAIRYLERSSNWGYRSPRMHLARLYLADKGNRESQQKAKDWLERAAIDFDQNEVGGWSAKPSDSVPLLFGIYLPSSGPKDLAGAEHFYRQLVAKKYTSVMLSPYLDKIPGLKGKLEAERQAAAAAANSRSESSSPRKKTCWRHYNGYEDCRYQ